MASSTRTCSGVPLGITADARSGADAVAGFAPAPTSVPGHGVFVLEHPASSNTGMMQSHMRMVVGLLIGMQCTADTNVQPLHIGEIWVKSCKNYLARRGKIEAWETAQRNPDRGYSAPTNSSPSQAARAFPARSSFHPATEY